MSASDHPESKEIWQSFLRNSSKRIQNIHGTCVIVGDAQSGKADLIAKICADKNLSVTAEEEEDEEEIAEKADLSMPKKELLGYNFFYIDDDDDTTDDSRVNVWSFNDHMMEHSFSIVGPDTIQEERFVFVITVDLSKPQKCVESLRKWLYKAAAYLKLHFNIIPHESASIQKSTVNYLKNARLSKGMGEDLCNDPVEIDETLVSEEKKEENGDNSATSTTTADEGQATVESKEEKESAEEKGDSEEKSNTEADNTPIAPLPVDNEAKKEDKEKFEFISKFYGLPLIVVGCKSDLISMEDAASIREARELQGHLRALCLEVGAALIYTTTEADLNPEAEKLCNMLRLKKYIEHRLYPENLLLQHQQKELVLEDTVNETFIPGGYDTTDLIKYSTGVEEKDNFRQEFDESKIESIVDTSDHMDVKEPETVEIETEQEWLTNLYSFVTTVSGGAVVSEEKTDSIDKVKDDSLSKKRQGTFNKVANSDNVGDFFKNLLQQPHKK